jgi:uncharacterized membrane protein
MVSQHTHIGREVAEGNYTLGGARNAVNVGDAERLLSLTGGGLLALVGLKEGSLFGLGLAAVGAGLVYRGVTGHCPVYNRFGVSTADEHSPVASVAAGKGFKVVESVAVQRSAEDLYRMWRDFERLPRFMSHLLSVRTEGRRSHWIARGPAGSKVEWDAEVINEDPGRMIAWRSLQGSRVDTAGSVHFTPLGGERGTQVTVTLKYDPPGGKLGSWVAWLFGEEPSLQIRDDLRRFKQMAEAGEIPHEGYVRRF